MINKIVLVILTLFFLYGCETQPPTGVEVPKYGKVFVTSNVDSAKIIVDSNESGYYTPDTLELKVGNYRITLTKDGYFSGSSDIEIIENNTLNLIINLSADNSRKVVLVEDFSNVSCNPCVESNKILKSLKESYTVDKLAIIKYPTNFPSPNDPMYLANTDDSNERMSYYSVLFTPTIIVDGVDKPIASDSNSIKEDINKNLLESSHFTISAVLGSSGSNKIIHGSITLNNATDIDFTNLVLHSVIIEREINYSTPPGSNGETVFENVCRKMLPNNKGYSITNIESELQINFDWETELNSSWNEEMLSIVLFVQNSQTKKVYQAIYVE
jgi:hypothetical protein